MRTAFYILWTDVEYAINVAEFLGLQYRFSSRLGEKYKYKLEVW